MDPFIGQIQAFGFNFAPRGWAKCDGQLLAISQYSALFSLLGTMYGGDGRTTFGLPDLRGRIALHSGHGPGLSDIRQGNKGGAEQNYLNVQQMPSHTHAAQLTVSVPASEEDADQDEASGKYLANGTFYHNQAGGTYGAGPIPVSGQIGPAGGNLPVNNVQPYLGVNYCIALTGIFPSRS